MEKGDKKMTTMKNITNHMETLESLELVTWLGAITERKSFDFLDTIFDDRLALENEVLKVFQDHLNPITEEQKKAFFELH